MLCERLLSEYGADFELIVTDLQLGPQIFLSRIYREALAWVPAARMCTKSSSQNRRHT